jgi:hypothetical protein
LDNTRSVYEYFTDEYIDKEESVKEKVFTHLRLKYKMRSNDGTLFIELEKSDIEGLWFSLMHVHDIIYVIRFSGV